MLSQEVEADYPRAHVQVGMGFNKHMLCKAESKVKKIANELDAAEAGERVRVVSETMVNFNSIISNQFRLFISFSPFLFIYF